MLLSVSFYVYDQVDCVEKKTIYGKINLVLISHKIIVKDVQMPPVKKRTYKIGLIVADIEDDFSNAITCGAMRAAEKTGDSLFIFPVKYIDLCNYDGDTDPKQRYEYQYNLLFAYAKSQRLDMLLIGMSSIGFRSTKEKCAAVLRELSDSHIFLLCSTEKGCSSAMYRNESGFRDGMEYLINTRGCRHICMLSGLVDANEDAREREAVYRAVMAEHDLDVSEHSVQPIRDSAFCEAEADTLIRNNPDIDAIVCFNDATAEGAYLSIRKAGKIPGKDIAVLGFDDIPSARELDPPLSTVKADAALLAEQALFAGHKMLDENDFTPIRIKIDTEFVLRESASGICEKPMSVAEYQHQLEAYKSRLSNIRRTDKRMNVVSRDMLMFGNSNHKNFSILLDALNMPEIGDSFLYLFNKPVSYRKDAPWKIPNTIYLRAYKVNGRIIEPSERLQRMSIDDIYGNRYFTASGHSMMFIDIYSREMQYGVLVCDVPYYFFRYVEQMCFQISIAVKIMKLFSNSEALLANTKTVLKRLEKENLILGKISNKDELTSILNRRGFVMEADEMLDDPSFAGKRAAIFYADLNYLKLINDRYGHSDGDYAIMTCAQAFTEVFGTDAIVSRIGGDEFAAIILLGDSSGAEYASMVKQLMTQKNRVSGVEYPITLSIGYYEFTVSSSDELKFLMDKADEKLYIDKLQKPSFEIG